METIRGWKKYYLQILTIVTFIAMLTFISIYIFTNKTLIELATIASEVNIAADSNAQISDALKLEIINNRYYSKRFTSIESIEGNYRNIVSYFITLSIRFNQYLGIYKIIISICVISFIIFLTNSILRIRRK